MKPPYIITKYGKDWELLDQCIAHWTRLATKTRHLNEGYGAKDCALCREYNRPENLCTGCPIANHTGLPSCIDTPYDDILDAEDEFYLQLDTVDSGEFINSPEFILIAEKELAFLKNPQSPHRK